MVFMPKNENYVKTYLNIMIPYRVQNILLPYEIDNANKVAASLFFR